MQVISDYPRIDSLNTKRSIHHEIYSTPTMQEPLTTLRVRIIVAIDKQGYIFGVLPYQLLT